MSRAGGRRGEMSMRKVAFASFIGTAIEFYDFYIYGTAAALVLGGAFFPVRTGIFAVSGVILPTACDEVL